MGIPAIAVSLETHVSHHLTYSKEVDFSSAAAFTYKFAAKLLERPLPKGVDLLKIDVPSSAKADTGWQWTSLSLQRYYTPVKPSRDNWDELGTVGYQHDVDLINEDPNTDVYVLLKKRLVSVTPITLDMTARLPQAELNLFAGD